MALGARNQDVLSLVMKEGVVLVAAGTIIGMSGAWAVSRMLSAMNSSVGTVSSTSTSDPVVLIGDSAYAGPSGVGGLLRSGPEIDAHRYGGDVTPGVGAR